MLGTLLGLNVMYLLLADKIGKLEFKLNERKIINYYLNKRLLIKEAEKE